MELIEAQMYVIASWKYLYAQSLIQGSRFNILIKTQINGSDTLAFSYLQ